MSKKVTRISCDLFLFVIDTVTFVGYTAFMVIKKILKVSLIVFCSLVVSLSLVFAGFEIKKALYFQKDLELPVFCVNTKDSQTIESKEDYIECEVSVSNTEEKFEFQNKTAKIRGRGNTTWEYPKKPYKLKFEEKVDLFGNGKAKTWTLIADYKDESLMRNRLAYTVGAVMENLEWTTSVKSVDLYVNNEYVGVYLVCEQVETGSNRVDIDESMESVDTGYLIELDERAYLEGELDKDYFKVDGMSFALKTPDTEDESFNVDYLNFIKNYVTGSLSALKGESYDVILSLIDVESFAETYIIHELFKNVDVAFSSFYMYKDSGGKLCSGPIWDFDLSCASNEVITSQYDYLEQTRTPNAIYATENKFYKYLLSYEEFRQLVSNKLEYYESKIKNVINSECDYVLKNESKSFERNFMKWGNLIEKTIHTNTWEKDVEYVREFLLSGYDYLISYYK